MNKPTLSGHAEESFKNAPALSLGARLDRRRGVHSAIELHVRRLEYFMDLLETGYRHALQPDPLPRSLRTERIALCIDLPELDTVPLWSVQRTDGAVAIPFIEFIVTEIGQSLAKIADEAVLDGRTAGDDLLPARAALLRILERARPGGADAPGGLPRLGDLFLPREVLDEIGGPRGLLARIGRTCESLLADRPRPTGH